MTDKENIREEINRLANEYKISSSEKKQRLKQLIAAKVSEYFPYHFSSETNVNTEDFRFQAYEIAVDKIIGIDSKGREKKSILEYDWKEDGFMSYLQESIKNAKKDILLKKKREQLVDEPQPDKTGNSPYDVLEMEYNVLKILALMQVYQNHLSTKQNNPTRRKYTALFYTERVSEICKLLYYENSIWRKNISDMETIIMRSLVSDFLNHFMSEYCDNVRSIVNTDYRKNGYFGIRQSSEEMISSPFDNKVYTTYFEYVHGKNALAQTVSEQRGYFEKLLQEVCGK